MKKIVLVGKLVLTDFAWKFNPINKKSWEFVLTTSRGNRVSFVKVFQEFEDEDVLEVTIKKVKK